MTHLGIGSWRPWRQGSCHRCRTPEPVERADLLRRAAAAIQDYRDEIAIAFGLAHADEIVGKHAIANPTMRFAWNAIATGIR